MKETVKDVMNKDVISVLPSDKVEFAAKFIAKYDVGSIPVISERELKGNLTDRYVVVRCVSKEKPVNNTKVSELMIKNVAFVSPEQSVHDALSMMAAERVRRLPIVKGGLINEMINLVDIAKIDSGPEIALALSEIN